MKSEPVLDVGICAGKFKLRVQPIQDPAIEPRFRQKLLEQQNQLLRNFQIRRIRQRISGDPSLPFPGNLILPEPEVVLHAPHQRVVFRNRMFESALQLFRKFRNVEPFSADPVDLFIDLVFVGVSV